MQSGELSAVQITQLYLDRIAAIDDAGPALHAVIEINPDALAIAARLDRERAEGNVRGPLHGIPILLKDNIETGDKMETTAGSLALAGHRARQDAFIVKRLREAGAIILGKTNMTEWANFRSPHAISGWSSRGGQTKNPYDLSASPCGSSSGSAVAVAADLCAAAVGTSTNGSIACPASFNGVVGLRPSLGLLSRSGIIPFAPSQDTPGPITRTVEDAMILLEVMSGPDPADPLSDAFAAGRTSSSPSFNANHDLTGKRIGIDRSVLSVTAGMGPVLQTAIARMKAAGAVIVEAEFIEAYDAVRDAQFIVLAYEFYRGITEYLSKADTDIQSLDQLIAFNRTHAREVMPYFEQEYLEQANTRRDPAAPEYLAARRQIAAFRDHLAHQMDSLSLDAIAGLGYGGYSPPALAGFPSVTVPTGEFNGLPVGITFFALPYAETPLLSIANAYERLAPPRKLPGFSPGKVLP